AVALDGLVEFVREHLDAEHRRSRQDEDDPDRVEHTLLAPVVGSEGGDLLRRSGAFDRARGHREDSGSPAQALEVLPGFWVQVDPAVARRVRSVDGPGHYGDAAAIYLEVP